MNINALFLILIKYIRILKGKIKIKLIINIKIYPIKL